MRPIQSPSNSLVFSSTESLSPPPTPGRKRPCCGINSTNVIDDTPLFFSSANSLISEEMSSDKEHKISPFDSFARLVSAQSISSSSMPMKLKARPIYGTKFNEDRIQQNIENTCNRNVPRDLLNDIPALPYDFPVQPSIRGAGKGLVTLSEETNKITATAVSSQVNKMTSFQRSGMMMAQTRVSSNKRNCYVARSA
ncbi:hypothetical protein ACHAXS_007241 [Conticribra weissflogii]